ncbi:MAG TPA: hypothetical protein VHV83_02855 [Armatimonadota bacterium]|nr:hypothetical protein [Armatimonadota bacterium]
MLPLIRRTLLALILLTLVLPVFAQDEVPSTSSGTTTTPAATTPPVAAPPTETSPVTPPSTEGTVPPPIVTTTPSTPGEGTPPPPPPPSAPPPPQPEPLPPASPGTVPMVIRSNRQILQPSEGLFLFLGEVTLETPHVSISADEVTYNDRTRSALARGNVSIRLEDGNTYWGNILEYSIATTQWRFLDFSVEYPAGFLGPPFIAPVFVNGQEASGLPHGLRATNSVVTTCDLPTPHYELQSRRVDIYPGDKLIARDNDVYVLGHRVLHIPWFFLSLRQRRTPIVPEVGKNELEGYFARFLYQYVFSPDQLGGVRLDLTEKRGVGIGVDHFYTVPAGDGEAFLYGRQGLGEYVVRVDHDQLLPGQIKATVHTDIRQDSQFTPQPTTVTALSTILTRNTTHTGTSFNFTRRLSEGLYSVDNITSTLQYNSSVAAGNLRSSFEYSSFGRTGSSASSYTDQELWSRLQWAHTLGFANFNVRVDKRTDVDGNEYTGDNNVSGVERLPEMYLETTQKDLHLDVLKAFPSRFTLGWGIFDEMSSHTTLNRYRFEWQSQGTKQFGGTALSGTTSFRQTVYGDADATAEYMYNAGVSATTKLGFWSNVARFTIQNSRGYTPFRFDVVYPYQNATDTLQYTTAKLRLYLASGRDIQNDRWQDLSMRLNAYLAKYVTTSQSLAYDFNTGKWRDLISQFNFENDPLVIFSIGSRYDLENKQLRTISTQLSWVITPKWRLQWLGGYDGITKQILENEILITRDLHCWDASLYYSAEQKYTYFYVRLKALNTPLPRFGIGRGGQVLDTSQGMSQ